RHRREAVHDQRASRAAGGDRGDQSEERHATAGAHRAERAAEEHVPGAGRLDQGPGSGQGEPLARRITSESERSTEPKHHGKPRGIRDGEALGWKDAAGVRCFDAYASTWKAVT